MSQSQDSSLSRLQQLSLQVESGGGEAALKRQLSSGRLSARQRIDSLLDPGSFSELDKFASNLGVSSSPSEPMLSGDGVVTGFGTINGRDVAVFSQDFTVKGGSLGLMHARKISKLMDLAAEALIPIIGINDSGGARIQSGVDSQAGYGEIFRRNALYSGLVPQLSVILGPCAGGAAYSPALTDAVFVVDKISKMFVTGPSVIKSVLGEDVSQEDLGGALTLAQVSGNAHFFASSEQECFLQIRQFLSFLPQGHGMPLPLAPGSWDPHMADVIQSIIPQEQNRPYDVRDVIRAVSDDASFFEVHQLWAPNIVVGFGRIQGRPVGFVANQPLFLAGVLDCDAACKASRFVTLCDAYDIPLVTFEDMPGCLPGADQEHAGVIRNGGKLLYAYSTATVPRLTVILRKAFGGGYVAMNSRHLGADFVAAWPDAQISVMGPEAAVKVVYKDLLADKDPSDPVFKEKVQLYASTCATPFVAASKGYVDAVIPPSQTRATISRMLSVLQNKRALPLPSKKHGIPPM